MTRPAPGAAPVRAYVAFGANLGDPAAALEQACAALDALPATRVAACSALYRSAPVDVSGQPDYLNAVIALDTALPATALLAALLDTERAAGRRRDYPQAPRTLDLDLLLYGEEVLDLPQLQVPHPRMHRRAFVLRPLTEIAPQVRIPGHGPAIDLLPGVADQAIVRL
ncbi:2-amino-4-hydroxy-6-hydroxymethyldihydropteridine diphosphokinase [Pseudothauera nasutitermitis]|uniref:2-amino-4-hydroxy-6-hydroxymethyldihydropteridine pyrophosphokinase n=1 Tax=Pseudothauera nasutitermitis TaxID=2565930 RepID=A0A4S4APB1_9RHOO|nr:2-amino-4-hydroxy-6-hydroxymethyldihydropteridine diphosphokinase [Pseudothauera nasutitermitis]THF61483.1 2-amino-4-hydroxy-6-hydroxymethyldihydropteridine diphosphokinase [Pseudothauera nasutitermitis]